MEPKQVDHRWSARHTIALPVKLFDGGQALAQGRTQNVGIGGMFVELQETAPEKLSANTQVSVAFSIDMNGSTSHHRLPATVIWAGGKGAGLMFTDFNVETVHTLRDILYPEEHIAPN